MHKSKSFLFSALRLVVTLLLGLCGWLALPAQAAFSFNAADNTVTDNRTGLIWDRCALGLTGSDCQGDSRNLSWYDAMTAAKTANGSNYSGHKDWRLPNIKELRSLVDLSKRNPAIDGTAFPVGERVFWSSTHNASSVAYDSSVAWYVNFNNGISYVSRQGETFRVRLVRGGQSFTDFDSLASPTSPVPTVTSIVPASGTTLGGTAVNITGSNLTGATSVTIGGNACTTISVVSDNAITCTTPAGTAGTVSVLVTTAIGTNVANTLFTYSGIPPTVMTVTPSSGSTAGGILVTLTGSNLGDVKGVTIGGSACTNISVNTTNTVNTLTCTTTAGTAGTASVLVTTASGINAANTLFTYVAPPPAPTVTTINPPSDTTLGGNIVTLTGSNLAGATGVTIGGHACTPLSTNTDTAITCTIPAGNAGLASVRVTTASGGSNADNTLFTYYVPSGPLNDTGQSCAKDTSTPLVWEACTAANSGPTATVPGQDGRYGRDAAFAAGKLTKIGGGSGGFDFTRICFNGAAEGTTSGTNTCTGTLVANTTEKASATPATDWACTKDNVTNLIWSLQSGYGNWTTYATVTLPDEHNKTNAGVGRCGGTGWRLPTSRELESIIAFDRAKPSIDTQWFPGTVSGFYWTNDVVQGFSDGAWFVDFDSGLFSGDYKVNTHLVRLVRGGQ